jgi:hypothetical protein
VTRRGVGWLCGTQMLAVVGLAFGRVAQDGVGFGNLDEALGGPWVVGVAVWMVGFGEFVEGPLWVLATGYTLWDIESRGDTI